MSKCSYGKAAHIYGNVSWNLKFWTTCKFLTLFISIVLMTDKQPFRIVIGYNNLCQMKTACGLVKCA